jgi:hypothetical protein
VVVFTSAQVNLESRAIAYGPGKRHVQAAHLSDIKGVAHAMWQQRNSLLSAVSHHGKRWLALGAIKAP